MAEGKNNDLKVRSISALFMMLIAGGALYAGGWFFGFFMAAAGIVILKEWMALSNKIATTFLGKFIWAICAIIYIGLAVAAIILFRVKDDDWQAVLALISVVIATDVGAYFAGRSIGGPKLAPKISPNKTWAGLIGGMSAAGIIWVIFVSYDFAPAGGDFGIAVIFLTGAFMAILAQGGDLLESWMKRRAGVKDSGNFIPGHGGLFDRADGMIALFFVIGLTHIIILRDMVIG
ncbi:hypothetical protein LPB140_09205 [Sphingorhabdus lutea]|uniref:Phosphatidate cytidylyltransferase n=1 Tax=Sphingorhabdus lutea TaxID=1913578 RepID=A0A1L3JCS2_9SPHN|nr:phosphatidate cytidylyltransferase [Sphingorhabdus lutea]APG62935.1 hypothetical protein LPB140_09205 [Sphingorhabdus lutea]